MVYPAAVIFAASVRTILAEQGGSHEVAFRAFVQKHNRSYDQGTDEYEQRRKLFRERLEEVESWNSQPDRSWTAGINHLSDWSEDEKKSLFGYAGHAVDRAVDRAVSYVQRSQGSFLQQAVVPPALEVQDILWDTDGVGLLENQGGCGSCWAVAAANMAQLNHHLHNKNSESYVRVRFSAQELVDCTPNPAECGGTGGCQGATVELAMAYMSQQGDNSGTAYTGRDGKCATSMIQEEDGRVYGMSMSDLSKVERKFVKAEVTKATQFSSWERLPMNEARPLRLALLQGSVAVSVAASEWMSYSAGIFGGCDKDATINHAVLTLGYGQDKALKQKYWLIQNSWGNWGEGGRIRLLRHEEDIDYCGDDKRPLDGTECAKADEAPRQTVTVCGMCGILYDSVIARFNGQ